VGVAREQKGVQGAGQTVGKKGWEVSGKGQFTNKVRAGRGLSPDESQKRNQGTPTCQRKKEMLGETSENEEGGARTGRVANLSELIQPQATTTGLVASGGGGTFPVSQIMPGGTVWGEGTTKRRTSKWGGTLTLASINVTKPHIQKNKGKRATRWQKGNFRERHNSSQ